MVGIKVLIREPNRVNESYSQTLAIGRLVGKAKAAKALVKDLKKRVAQSRRDIESQPRVMLILGVGRTPFTMLPNSWGGDIVTKAKLSDAFKLTLAEVDRVTALGARMRALMHFMDEMPAPAVRVELRQSATASPTPRSRPPWPAPTRSRSIARGRFGSIT